MKIKRQGDKATRRQGDRDPARPHVPLSPCPLVPLSPRVRPSARRRRGAFTLPEVLASMVLVGLVLPAVMKGVSLATAASDDARKRIEAVALAETKLSELTGAAATSQAASPSGDFGAEWPAFRWESSSNSVDTDLNEIRVRVVWQARGIERSVDLSTFAYVGLTTGSLGNTTSGTPAPPAGGTP